ncbi:MAG TPA: MerR family transcriptional regulator, partial [Brachybacterium faecium]|nr:MerR family transcriptional regulator [Brachybacterium faecium]
MDQTLLSIGELAAASGLSPKALRLYDDSELLVPRRVDPFTGYRSYGRDQVRRARFIAALRGLGMGLARIRVLCDLDGAAAAAELRSWWRQI